METGFITNIGQPNYFQYSLVVIPEASVNEKLMLEKQQFVSTYGHKTTVKKKSHITIANFFAREAMEDTIIRYMHRIFSNQCSFETALNNYSGYPPHTIYVRVQDLQPFRQIVSELKVVNNYIQSCSCPHATIIFNPHITLAKTLPENIYSRALMDYSHKSFHEKLVVKELILQRKSHEYDDARTVQVFALQPKSI